MNIDECIYTKKLSLNKPILAHRIGKSEILLWVIKSYLTHGILPRLSRED